MTVFLTYIIQFIPTLLALVMECGIVKYAIKILREAKETKEFKIVSEQNKLLIAELRESQKLNKELLTKIDRIARGDNNEK